MHWWNDGFLQDSSPRSSDTRVFSDDEDVYADSFDEDDEDFSMSSRKSSMTHFSRGSASVYLFVYCIAYWLIFRNCSSSSSFLGSSSLGYGNETLHERIMQELRKK